jgi:hypothetical protein
MIGGSASPPAGYAAARVGGAEVVARTELLPAVCEALAAGTLHEYARRHPAARPLTGRVTAFAAPLPGAQCPVVVRHSHHGGLFAPLTRDRFLPPTRAPRELRTARRLADLGVPTPPVIAYVVYPAGWLLRRSDVATLEIEGGADLAAILMGAAHVVARSDALTAAASLLRTMARAGVHHPDLNLKNILVAAARERREGGDAALTSGSVPLEDGPGRPPGVGPDAAVAAYLLDVDRVRFRGATAAEAASANAERLARSSRRWRERHGAPISAGEIAALHAAALGGSA